MLTSLTSLLAVASTFTSLATALPARLPSDPSLYPSESDLLPRGPFILPGSSFTGSAYQGVQWGNRTFQAQDYFPCTDLGWDPWFGIHHWCPNKWYDNKEFEAQPGVACPNNTISGEGSSWVSISDVFLNKNGSLRKHCGKKVTVTVNNTTIEAEIRRSCNGKTACTGENAIGLSPFAAKELGVQNDLLKGKEVSWTYVGA
ncbi:uncharacterized protein JCM6883_006174 [Sporobolomyces salmoneus]|uniref:uncharacterized protein n=1 Tax=Sporobolomyces salmoneus TaxID=183962 RepID=UPI0031802F3C